MTTINGVTTVKKALAVAAAAIIAATGFSSVVAAHDEIDSSVPAHQSQFDEPISQATINFGAPVDGVELALIGPDNRVLPGTVTKLSDTSARIDFELLTVKGEYLVRYLAEEDGHLVAGAITFVYGSKEGTGAGPLVWIGFGLVAAAILGVGAFYSLRRGRRPDAESGAETTVG